MIETIRRKAAVWVHCWLNYPSERSCGPHPAATASLAPSAVVHDAFAPAAVAAASIAGAFGAAAVGMPAGERTVGVVVGTAGAVDGVGGAVVADTGGLNVAVADAVDAVDNTVDAVDAVEGAAGVSYRAVHDSSLVHRHQSWI